MFAAGAVSKTQISSTSEDEGKIVQLNSSGELPDPHPALLT